MLIHFKECFIKDDLSVLCNVWQALDSLVCRPCKRAKVHMKPFLQIGRHGNACTSLIYNVPWAWGPICIIAWTLHHCTIAVWHHLQWGMNNTGSKLSTGIYFEDSNHWVLLASNMHVMRLQFRATQFWRWRMSRHMKVLTRWCRSRIQKAGNTLAFT